MTVWAIKRHHSDYLSEQRLFKDQPKGGGCVQPQNRESGLTRSPKIASCTKNTREPQRLIITVSNGELGTVTSINSYTRHRERDEQGYIFCDKDEHIVEGTNIVSVSMDIGSQLCHFTEVVFKIPLWAYALTIFKVQGSGGQRVLPPILMSLSDRQGIIHRLHPPSKHLVIDADSKTFRQVVVYDCKRDRTSKRDDELYDLITREPPAAPLKRVDISSKKGVFSIDKCIWYLVSGVAGDRGADLGPERPGSAAACRRGRRPRARLDRPPPRPLRRGRAVGVGLGVGGRRGGLGRALGHLDRLVQREPLAPGGSSRASSASGSAETWYRRTVVSARWVCPQTAATLPAASKQRLIAAHLARVDIGCRCMFSESESRNPAASSTSTTRARISGLPSCWWARSRRRPAITSYPAPAGRTVIGCISPRCAMSVLSVAMWSSPSVASCRTLIVDSAMASTGSSCGAGSVMVGLCAARPRPAGREKNQAPGADKQPRSMAAPIDQHAPVDSLKYWGNHYASNAEAPAAGGRWGTCSRGCRTRRPASCCCWCAPAAPTPGPARPPAGATWS